MDTSSLMEQILSSDNLNRAYLQVVRNKGAEGVDGMKYTELKEHLAKNGEIIKEQLRTRKYKPQPVRRVEIPKPDGGVRNLGVPTVTDRFIQQAIAQVLTPIYEEQFHDHSYGFRPNRCAQQAILTALNIMNDGNDWIVDIDLEKFFDTVNHDKLMTLIGRTIKDGDVISIVRKYLVSGIMIDDEYEDYRIKRRRYFLRLDSTGGMNVAFKNLIYMLYSRDLSNKVSSAMHTRILKGENISGQLRYGYVKDPNDKHKIIVDPEAAEVVKLIFELTAQGKRKTEVANYLNAHGIDTPSAYKKRKGSKNFFHAVEVKSLWSTSSIHDILNDEVYLGKLIWNKTKKRVGSNNTSTYVPKDEWIVIENCHEPIITQKLFDTAHANSKKYIRPKRGKRNYNPFYYCGVCGRALVPSKRVKGDILLCSSSRIEENSPCKSNRVEIAKVENTIMKIVNMYATAYLDEKGIKKAGKSKEVSPEEKIATLEKKVKSLSSKKMMLYSDYKDDKLTREEYVKRSKAMVEQIDELHQEIEQLKTEIPPEDNSSSKFETQLESIINMESFDREKIQKVIKKVIINGEDNIEIVWNTDDPFFK